MSVQKINLNIRKNSNITNFIVIQIFCIASLVLRLIASDKFSSSIFIAYLVYGRINVALSIQRPQIVSNKKTKILFNISK